MLAYSDQQTTAQELEKLEDIGSNKQLEPSLGLALNWLGDELDSSLILIVFGAQVIMVTIFKGEVEVCTVHPVRELRRPVAVLGQVLLQENFLVDSVSLVYVTEFCQCEGLADSGFHDEDSRLGDPQGDELHKRCERQHLMVVFEVEHGLNVDVQSVE